MPGICIRETPRRITRKMEAREIIEFIGNAEKKTPVKVYVKEKAPVDFEGCQVFGSGDKIVSATGAGSAASWKRMRTVSRIT